MAGLIDWLRLIAEIILVIVKWLPKMGYAAARTLAFETVAARHGLDVDELETHCGGKIDSHFGR